MNTPPCSRRHDELTPGLVVRESLSVVSVELVLITTCALMFSFISARENRQTTCPMPWTGDRPPIKTESFCATPRFSDILRAPASSATSGRALPRKRSLSAIRAALVVIGSWVPAGTSISAARSCAAFTAAPSFCRADDALPGQTPSLFPVAGSRVGVMLPVIVA